MKFKVGDQVRIGKLISEGLISNKDYGKIGTITSLGRDINFHGQLYVVQLINEHYGSVYENEITFSKEHIFDEFMRKELS